MGTDRWSAARRRPGRLRHHRRSRERHDVTSLYRLERRGLLDCPILGVAVDDWTPEHLRNHARIAITASGEHLDESVFERFANRLSYVAGDFADAATFERVSGALGGAQTPVFYLEIPPFLFGRVV